MGDLGGILTTALAILAIATIAGAGLQRGRIGDLKGRLEQERADAAEDRAQAERDEVRATRDRAEAATIIAELESKLAKAKADIEVLKGVATGEIHWSAIAQRLEDLIALVMKMQALLKGGDDAR